MLYVGDIRNKFVLCVALITVPIIRSDISIYVYLREGKLVATRSIFVDGEYV